MVALHRLYDIAEPQSGYFTTAQADSVGVSRRLLTHYTKTGALQRMRYGLYRIARFPSMPYEDIQQALLWVGEPAAASHLTALVVYGLSDAMPARVHITVDRPFAGSQYGVVVHTSSLQPDETIRREGITVTSPLRTIADVAATDQQLASQALSEALERGIIRKSQTDLEASRYPDVIRLIESLEAT